jgi:hypothetical protein
VPEVTGARISTGVGTDNRCKVTFNAILVAFDGTDPVIR